MPPKCCLPICWEACNHAVEEGMRAAIARIMERLILASTRICILAACCIVGRHSTKLFQSHWGILHNALRIGVLKPRCFRKVSVCGTRLFVSQPMSCSVASSSDARGCIVQAHNLFIPQCRPNNIFTSPAHVWQDEVCNCAALPPLCCVVHPSVLFSPSSSGGP